MGICCNFAFPMLVTAFCDFEIKLTEIIMKGDARLIIIVIFISVMGLLSGCHHTPDERLLHAESIMEEHPDSALMILEDIDVSNLITEEDAALYGLLLTQARYKNFIDEVNDSIIRKSAYYFTNNENYEYASRALFLMGMIQMGDNKLGEAFVSLSKGMDMAKEHMFYMWEGQCARGLFMLYGHLLDSSSQLRYAEIAYDAFSKANYKDWKEYALYDMAISYNNNGKYEKAYSVTQDLMDGFEESGDSLLLEESTHLMGLITFNLGNHYESLKYYAVAFNLNPNVLTENDKKNIYYSRYVVGPDTISAEIKKLIDEIGSTNDYQYPYAILAKDGKYEEAYKNLELYKEEQDSIIDIVLKNNVSEFSNQYEENQARLEETKKRNERIVISALFIFFLMFVVILFLTLKVKLSNREARIANLMSNVESLKNDLQEQINQKTQERVSNRLSEKPYIQLLSETYSEANDLCDKYYQYAGMKTHNSVSMGEINNTIRNFTDAQYLAEIEKYVDEISTGLYSSFKREMYSMKEDSRRVFLYYLLGFSPRSISVLMNLRLDAVYNKKSRIKSAIVRSNASRKDEYLKILK